MKKPKKFKNGLTDEQIFTLCEEYKTVEEPRKSQIFAKLKYVADCAVEEIFEECDFSKKDINLSYEDCTNEAYTILHRALGKIYNFQGAYDTRLYQLCKRDLQLKLNKFIKLNQKSNVVLSFNEIPDEERLDDQIKGAEIWQTIKGYWTNKNDLIIIEKYFGLNGENPKAAYEIACDLGVSEQFVAKVIKGISYRYLKAQSTEKNIKEDKQIVLKLKSPKTFGGVSRISLKYNLTRGNLYNLRKYGVRDKKYLRCSAVKTEEENQ